MIEISKKVKDDVMKIVDYLVEYENKDNLSWTRVYKEALNKLKINNSNDLLSNVVKELSNRGYDIIGEPFKLERYR